MEISIIIGIYCCIRSPHFDRILLTAIGYSIQLSPTPSGNSSASSKVVMLTFGDTLKSQFTNAKPILDKYGFKGSFFITCLWVGSDKARMTWQDILALQMDGTSIQQSMTMYS